MSNTTHTGIRRGVDGYAPTFFFVSDVDHGPSLLYLFPERPNRGLILLRKLEGCLDLGRIVDDFAVELSTFLDQPLLLFVRFLQRSVQLFVLKPWFIEERYLGTASERGTFAKCFMLLLPTCVCVHAYQGS